MLLVTSVSLVASQNANISMKGSALTQPMSVILFPMAARKLSTEQSSKLKSKSMSFKHDETSV